MFTGNVVTYAASSSDTTVLEASVDGSVVILRGVAAGSATATVTATNRGGTTPVSFPVTVGAFAPPRVTAPQAAATLAAQEVAAGTTAEVAVAAGFSRTVTGYIPISDNRDVMQALPTRLGQIELRGIAEGTANLRIVAVNTGGIASQTVTVTVTDPNALRITATAPSHCLTGEGTPVTTSVGTVGRTGVATVDVTYTVTGGTAPYTITSSDTTTSAASATGVLAVSCALSGINLNNVAADVNVVESGPKTITLTATDTDGDTATAEVAVTIAEDASTTDYNDGIMVAGDTYVIGTEDEWALITLPTGLDLRFEGVATGGGSYGVGYFTDTVTGSMLLLEWGTGIEAARVILPPPASTDSSRNARAPRDLGALFTMVAKSNRRPTGVAYGRAEPLEADDWRPYEGLPSTASLAVHEKMQAGMPISVCNGTSIDDFDPADFTADHDANKSATQLKAAFDLALGQAVALWDKTVGTGRSLGGTDHVIFEELPATSCNPYLADVGVYHVLWYQDECASLLERFGDLTDAHENPAGMTGTTVTEAMVETARDAYLACITPFKGGGVTCNNNLGCAWTEKLPGVPPKINADIPIAALLTVLDTAEFKRNLVHEIGHVLGLGDYMWTCARDENGDEELSLYSYFSRCRSTAGALITEGDAMDLHALYHPRALRRMWVTDDRSEIRGWMSLDTEGNFEHNAHRVLVGSRSAGTTGAFSVVGAADLSIRTPSDNVGWRLLGTDLLAGQFRMSFDGALG